MRSVLIIFKDYYHEYYDPDYDLLELEKWQRKYISKYPHENLVGLIALAHRLPYEVVHQAAHLANDAFSA